ncbi:5'-3' exoribonuclease 2 [Anthophora quadrimaculata]
MGVPAFFRWLSRKYPSVITECIEQKPITTDGVRVPVNSAEPNPNGVEFDNLYLDMNGIIHPCTHPEDKPAPKNEDEMMEAIFECIDRLFCIVRPRKLLYLAIDGVAPRAKMNQQRSRRFRASKETNEKINEIKRIRSELTLKGASLPPEKPKEDHFDSNCITPGTPFMERLSKCLHYYIHDRLNSDPGWRNIKVILSDANVPGEGEHKIMDFIRRQRAQPDYDPNTQHVLCGADADLIIWGIPCKSVQVQRLIREKKRTHLDLKHRNDFLPHLPSLEIREGAIDRLVNLYKKTVYKTGGFLTDSGDVNLDRVQLIVSDLGDVEDEIFKKRQQNELAYKQREKVKQKRLQNNSSIKPKWIPTGQFAPTAIGEQLKPVENARYEAYQMRVQGQNYNSNERGKGNVRELLRNMMRPEDSSDQPRKRKSEDIEDESDEESHDEVRLWEDGFKDRYYESKFDVSSDNLAFRNNVALQYVRGLCWVLRYYYQGCASWKWYFPYHYAPFASDFINIGGLSTEFEKGTVPFRPLEQLMGVFPAASSKHVPMPWAKLMSDPRSPIIDFYPEDFKIDLNGKKFAWQGVVLLPFVDEKRLFKALEPYYELLTEAEKKRNIRGDDRLYVGVGNSGYNFIKGLYTNRVRFDAETPISIDGMRGTVLLAEDTVGEGATLPSPINGLLPVRNNKVYCIRYRDPKYSSNFIFPAKVLKGAKEPPRVLKPQDFERMNRNTGNTWKPQIGFTPSTQVASLNEAGRRILGHYTNHNRVPPPYTPMSIPQALYPAHHGYQSTDYQGGYESAGGSNQAAMLPGPWARGYGLPHTYNQQRYSEYQQRSNYSVQQYGRNNYQNQQYNNYGSQYNQQRNYSPNYQGNGSGNGGNRSGWRR